MFLLGLYARCLNTVLEILLAHIRTPRVTNTLFFARRSSAGEVEMTTRVLRLFLADCVKLWSEQKWAVYAGANL